MADVDVSAGSAAPSRDGLRETAPPAAGAVVGPSANAADPSANAADPSANAAGPSANAAGPSANAAGPSANAAGADPAALARRLRERHGEVYVLVGPPRTASTAIARILWNHPAVGFYSHEPFEPTWYQGAGVERTAALLDAPQPVADLGGRGRGRALVIKEMTFQVGDRFPLLAALATRPIVVLIRDPRQTVASRMRALRRAGRPEVFPLRESGWDDLARQLAYLRQSGIEHLVVDSSDLRARPDVVAPRVLEALRLDFDPALLRWEPSDKTGLSVVSGSDDPFYQRVLASTGLEAPSERTPDLSELPEDGGLRAHVAHCLTIYEQARRTAVSPEA